MSSPAQRPQTMMVPMSRQAGVSERYERLIRTVATRENRTPVRIEINEGDMPEEWFTYLTPSVIGGVAQMMCAGIPAAVTENPSRVYFAPVVGWPDFYDMPY